MRHQKQPRSTPWEVGDAPASFIAAQLKGIVGLEIEIDRLEGKGTVGQNCTEKDRRGVSTGFREKGREAEPIAILLAEYGLFKDS